MTSTACPWDECDATIRALDPDVGVAHNRDGSHVFVAHHADGGFAVVAHEGHLIHVDDVVCMATPEIQGLCESFGVDPGEVCGVEYIDGAAPIVRFTVYVQRDGHPFASCVDAAGAHWDHEGDCGAATTTVDCPVTGSLPAWWQPRALVASRG